MASPKRIDWFALNMICTQTPGSATALPPVSFSFLPVLADASPRSGFFALLPGFGTSPFFYLGKLIEFGPTVKIFTNPGEKQTEDYITGRFG